MDEETNVGFAPPVNHVTVYHAISVLNDAVARDPECLRALFAPLYPCAPALAAGPVEAHALGPVLATGVLGLLNGIFAYHAAGYDYRIFPVYDHGMLTEFRLGARPAASPRRVPAADPQSGNVNGSGSDDAEPDTLA